MMSESFLVLRRGGATWAVEHGAVKGVARRETGGGAASDDGGAFEVELAAGTLAADELLGVASGLTVRPAGAVLRRYWPEVARGLAVHGPLPLVLIDPAAPPGALRAAAVAEAAASVAVAVASAAAVAEAAASAAVAATAAGGSRRKR